MNPAEREPASKNIENLYKMAEEAATLINQSSHIYLLSHNDVDGITSASIMIQAFERGNINYNFKPISMIDEKFISSFAETLRSDSLIVFCDIGSGLSKELSAISNEIVILDHHIISPNSPAKIMVNPECFGLDGSYMLSASGVAYLVAKNMNELNQDLAPLAIVGMIGDRQLMTSVNALILDEGIKNGFIKCRYGLKIREGDLFYCLLYSIEPHFEITGNRKKVISFLKRLNIYGKKTYELTDIEMKRLADAVLFLLKKTASSDAIESVIGDICSFPEFQIKNAIEFAGLLEICWKQHNLGLAISICRNKCKGNDLKKLYLEYNNSQKEFVKTFKNALPLVKNRKTFSYFRLNQYDNIGNIASVYTRYFSPQKPCFCFNITGSNMKISARGTQELLHRGLNLSQALQEVVEITGGKGGGHNIAAGASIPIEKEKLFLDKMEEILEKQIQNESNFHIEDTKNTKIFSFKS